MVNHLVMKFGKLIDIVMSIVFRNCLSNYLLANLHVWPCKGSDPLFSFLAARMVDMSLRGTIAQIFFREHANWMFFKRRKRCLTSLSPQFIVKLNYFKLLSSPKLWILSGLCTRKLTWSMFFVFLSREEATRQWRKRESEWERERLAREKLMKAVSDAIVLHAERRVKPLDSLPPNDQG